MPRTKKPLRASLKPIPIGRCVFCRRKAYQEKPDQNFEQKSRGISLTCKRHRNRKVYVRFSMAPVSIQ